MRRPSVFDPFFFRNHAFFFVDHAKVPRVAIDLPYIIKAILLHCFAEVYFSHFSLNHYVSSDSTITRRAVGSQQHVLVSAYIMLCLAIESRLLEWVLC